MTQGKKYSERTATIQSTIQSNRSSLAETIPLDMPYMVFIDPCNACNFKCDFCAVQTLSHTVSYKHMMMDFQKYKKVIDDIAKFPRALKILRLYTMGEPLLNKHFPEMVAYAKEKNVADFIETVTNGSCLCPEMNQRLAECGIDRIRISVEGIDDESYKTVCHSNVTIDKLVENIADLFIRTRQTKTKIYVKTIDALVNTEEKREAFYRMFESISDTMFIESMIPAWPGFDDLNTRYEYSGKKITGGEQLMGIQCCPFVFYGMVVNPDGEVTPCCADWERGYVYGNAFEESLVKIWGGGVMRSLWKLMLEGKKDCLKSCRKCEYIQYMANDNIDNETGRILQRIFG